jgi:hypothetical protein
MDGDDSRPDFHQASTSGCFAAVKPKREPGNEEMKALSIEEIRALKSLSTFNFQLS